MNFFESISELDLQGDLHLVVTKTAENNLVVSVLLKNEKCGDQARNNIIPILIRGTAQELDAEFFQHVGAPLQKSSGIMVNMEAFLKSTEKASKESAEAAAVKKEQETKKKAFDDSMKKVDELIKEKKFAEALTKLPKATDYPDFATAIENKRKEAQKQGNLAAQASLFGDTPSALPVAEPVSKLTDDNVEDDDENEENEEEDQYANELTD